MHEKRNLLFILALCASVAWAFYAWLVLADPFGSAPAFIWAQRFAATALILVLGWRVYYALNVEDTHPDKLAEMVGPMYFDVDGLSFMPIMRVNENGEGELCIYYQNRFENYCNAVIHLRPPDGSLTIKPGVRDVHIAFRADGGDFGVIHQPVAIPENIQGDLIDVQLAAVSRFPRAHGRRLRSNEGRPCGSFVVDWEQAFKIGVHEVSGEIELVNSTILHLALPRDVKTRIRSADLWKQEQLMAGEVG